MSFILSPTSKEKWSPRTIEKILRNEKYTGKVVVYKSYRTGFPKKTVENKGQRAMFVAADNHPAIIDEATFKKVEEEMTRRSSVVIDEDGNRHRSKRKYSSKKRNDYSS